MTTLLKGLRRTGATTKMVDALFVQYHRTATQHLNQKGQYLLVLCYGRQAATYLAAEINKRKWGTGATPDNPFKDRIVLHDLSGGTDHLRGRRFKAENIFEDNSLDDMPFSMLDPSLAIIQTIMERNMAGLPSDADNSPIADYSNHRPSPNVLKPTQSQLDAYKAAEESYNAKRATNDIQKMIDNDPFREYDDIVSQYSPVVVESLRRMTKRGIKPVPMSPEDQLSEELDNRSKYGWKKTHATRIEIENRLDR